MRHTRAGSSGITQHFLRPAAVRRRDSQISYALDPRRSLPKISRPKATPMDTTLSNTISGSALAVCGRRAAWLVFCTGRVTPAVPVADTRATTFGRALVWMTAAIGASFSSGVTATIGTVSRSVRLRLVTSTAIAGTTAFDAFANCTEFLFRSSARTLVARTNASTVTATRIQIVFLIITLISFEQHSKGPAVTIVGHVRDGRVYRIAHATSLP